MTKRKQPRWMKSAIKTAGSDLPDLPFSRKLRAAKRAAQGNKAA